MQPDTPTRARILIVEDDAAVARLLEVLVERHGMQPQVCATGEQALQAVEAETPDLILLDLMLPGVDGYEVCRRIKADVRWEHVPIAMCTAKQSTADMVQGLGLGADDYIRKPFNPIELIARVRTLLRVGALIKQSQQAAVTDSLTGLFNYREFYSQLERELERVRRYHRPAALLLLDVDEFKGVNDRLGHLAGDAALREIAALLKHNTRPTDLVARYGGEEFAVLLSEVDMAQARDCAERIRAAIAHHPFQLQADADPQQITVSIGIAAMTPDTATPKDLVRQADQALYRAKANGRDRLEVSPTPP